MAAAVSQNIFHPDLVKIFQDHSMEMDQFPELDSPDRALSHDCSEVFHPYFRSVTYESFTDVVTKFTYICKTNYGAQNLYTCRGLNCFGLAIKVNHIFEDKKEQALLLIHKGISPWSPAYYQSLFSTDGHEILPPNQNPLINKSLSFELSEDSTRVDKINAENTALFQLVNDLVSGKHTPYFTIDHSDS